MPNEPRAPELEKPAQWQGVSVRYPFASKAAVGPIELSIEPEERLLLLGPSGSGKSTLLQTLTGLIPQSIPAEVRGSVHLDRARKAEEALAAWDLAGLERSHPFELSQGQKRRLALATLTAGDRWPLLVLDEPLAGLDAKGAAMIIRLVERLRRSGRAIAIITHDMDFALRLCARSLILGGGGILAEGPTRELLADTGLLARAGLAEPAVAPAMRWLERSQAC